MNPSKIKKYADFCDQVAAYEICLLKLYGAVIGGHDLHHVLGYPSGAAFRQAAHRKTVPVQTFKQPGYRMRFARTHDIAKWLVSVGRELDELKSDENHLAVTQEDEINKLG